MNRYQQITWAKAAPKSPMITPLDGLMRFLRSIIIYQIKHGAKNATIPAEFINPKP